MYDKVFSIMSDIVNADEEYGDEGFAEYKDWYYTNGGQDTTDAEQLKWIFDSPNVANSLKRKLSRKITNMSVALEEEEDVLSKVRLTPEKLGEHIENNIKAIRNYHHHNCLSFSIVGGLALVCYFIFNILSSSSATTPGLQFISTVAACCFGVAAVCLMKVWDSKTKADRAEAEARERYELLTGRALQERIAKVKAEREEFYELDKTMAKYADTLG